MSTALTFCPLSFFTKALSCPVAWSGMEDVLLEDDGDSDEVLDTDCVPEKPGTRLVVGFFTGFSKNDLFV